ncbi:MAG: MBOAT family protein [Bacteroides sp.]|nr:MBOAT family protein [Bacteroides sp.]
MVFSDLFFIFVFLPAFVVVYLICAWLDKKVFFQGKEGVIMFDEDPEKSGYQHPKFIARNIALVIFSLIFYAWGEPIYIFLMIVCVILNYFSGLLISQGEKSRKFWLVIGLILNLAILGTFKYLGFFNDVLKSFGLDLGAPRLALPIGISFYIFQSISYLVDVYRRESPVQKNFLNLLLYISMFPQLIAGPIVRYGTVAHEINDRRITANDFMEGSYRFFIGLGKKVVLANILSEIATRFLADGVEHLSMWGAWIGILAFTLQIYFDFSGYSDMAIGMGRAMGFHFNENFNHPYCCNSVTDFWRRWHMSLGSFFRDYTYIPMGGNRRHQMLNLLTVWFLTGMWHGASWNFIIWGLYFGLVLVIEKYAVLKVAHRIPRFLMHIYALIIVVIGWAIFYFDNFDNMREWFASAFGQKELAFSIVEETAITDYFWLWVVAIILCLPVRRWIETIFARMLPAHPAGGNYLDATLKAFASVAILVLCVALLVGATNNAFIYTRF